MLETLTYIFCFVYLLLPEYFAVEVSASLPLLTAGRVAILIVLFFFLYQRNFRLPYKLHVKYVEYFFVILIAINLIHIVDCPSDSIKTIFSLVFEQWLLILILIHVLNSKGKIEKACKSMVWASAILGALSIVESVIGFNIFNLLTTTNRSMLQSVYERLGFVRAVGPFGHAVYFGVYCTAMIPFSLYFYEKEKKVQYLVIAFLNIIGTLFSGSRGQILTLGIMLIYMMIKKKTSIKIRYLGVIFALIPVIIGLSMFMPAITSGLNSIIQATLSAIGFKFTADSSFGDNANGVYSRILQLSGIAWLALKMRLLTGLGANCHVNGLVKYFTEQYGWTTYRTFDVGYVGLWMQYGIIGLIAYLKLIISSLRKSIKLGNEADSSNMFNAFKYFFVGYLLNLVTTVGVDRVFILVFSLFLAYYLAEKNGERKYL